jgi:hypothetical protein
MSISAVGYSADFSISAVGYSADSSINAAGYSANFESQHSLHSGFIRENYIAHKRYRLHQGMTRGAVAYSADSSTYSNSFTTTKDKRKSY